ncbi:MAG TPA: alpha/beta hydrolase [Pseudonocardiaceae bacterium]|nr:alpha/beta hydrolase [Pseudonocardiaceae bacterium]
MTLEEARAEDLRSIQAGGGQPQPVAQVENTTVPGKAGDLKIRIYRPNREDKQPALAYFFGGGWTLGTIDTSDGVCRALTNKAECVTIAVGYRRAPENKFPAAVEDCHTAVTWLADNAANLGIDKARIAVGGDSAGGNLAAAITLMARQAGPRLIHQLLVYPNTDYRSDTKSLKENTDEALFNTKSVDWYWRHYLANEEDGDSPLASPLRAESLTGLPPATVITAEYDPLRDQAEQYADRLRAAGVEVELARYAGQVHGFFTMSGVLDAAGHAVDHAAGRLKDAFTTALVP